MQGKFLKTLRKTLENYINELDSIPFSSRTQMSVLPATEKYLSLIHFDSSLACMENPYQSKYSTSSTIPSPLRHLPYLFNSGKRFYRSLGFPLSFV